MTPRSPTLLCLALALAVGLAGVSAAQDEESQLGQEAFERGDLADALVHWSQALQLAREAGDAAAELDLLLRLAAINRELGRLEPAAALLDEAGALAKRADDPTAAPRVDTAVGLLALTGGDARRAEKVLQRAFQGHQGADDPAGAANAAINLGLARMALGKGDEARKAFAAADTLFSALGDRDGRADALTDVGISSRRDGRWAEARSSLEDAVELYRATGNLAGEADAQNNLALLLADLGQVDDARALLEDALATARARKDVPRQATLLLNLGTLAHRAGDDARAATHYRAAEEAFTAAGLEADATAAALNGALVGEPDAATFEALLQRSKDAGDRRLEAIASLNLASQLRGDDDAAAARYAGRAAQLADDLELSQVRWRARYLAGRLDLDAGRDKAGIDELRAAVDELERTRRTLEPGQAEEFVTGHEEVYQALIDALLQQGDSLGAFVYAERLQRTELPAPTLPEGEASERYRELEREQAWLEDQLRAELRRAPGAAENQRAEALRAQLAQLRVEFAASVDELRASYPEFDQAVRVDPEDLEAIQGDLDPGVVVLQPVLLPDQLVLMVFRRDRLVSRTVVVDAEDVDKTIRRLTRTLRAGTPFDREWTDLQCDRLGGWLIAPIAGELEGAEVLVVSKTGPFRQLPFGLLRHDERYLVEDVAVVGVTHVGSLRGRAADQTRFRLDGPGLLLVGNPDGSLPGAETEVKTIASRFPGATVLQGPQGTRSALYRAAPQKTTLHLATHGVIDLREPNRSYLILHDDPPGEGKLTYREIPGLAPYLGRCRLVVLSACESGLAVDAPEPDEGHPAGVSIEGLAAQFRRAGVETLVGSLWKVDDAGTLELMGGFYDALGRGTDVGRALQHAQQSMIASGEEYSHPWYWAGFTVVGDWR